MSQQAYVVIEWSTGPKLVGPFEDDVAAQNYLKSHDLLKAEYEVIACCGPAEFKEELRVYRLRQDWKAAVENDQTEDGFSTWVRQQGALKRQALDNTVCEPQAHAPSYMEVMVEDSRPKDPVPN